LPDALRLLTAVSAQFDLFGAPAPALPEGMSFREDFISEGEEAALLERIRSLDLQEARYKAYTARRRTMSFGSQYDYDDNRLLAAPAIPAFLHPLRARLAEWAGIDADAFTNALVAEYRPATPLGWHRDVPDYELVAGVSLAGEARMRLRPYPPVSPKKEDIINLTLPPCSAYILKGVARWGWQHSIAPTPGLRYSITFRTRRHRNA
jgi:alkylated DNA repair dioxygenase AlkB